MKKGLLIIALLAIFGSVGYGLIELRDDNVRLEADIADYRRQLREQTESGDERRQEMAQRAGDLQQELAEARNQLVNLSNQLSETREMISPDYERLLQQGAGRSCRGTTDRAILRRGAGDVGGP